MTAEHTWINPDLEVKQSKKHGQGIFAKKDLRKGERLAIFGGYVMPISQLATLPEELQDLPMQIEERFVLASQKTGRPENVDFFNHNCDPNSGFKGQIFLVAMRDIKKGEEITFDYAMVVSQSFGSNIIFKMGCKCGSGNCRKIITENDWELPELRHKYNGYFSQYLQEKIDIDNKK